MQHNYLYFCAFALSILGCAGTLQQAPVSVTPRAAPAPISSGQTAERAEALLQALLALGIDYKSGGRSPALGFDCSGLVVHVYKEAFGVRLPRSAREQSESGRAVSLAEVQAGDLVFYDTQNRPFSHVGIYLGDGRFVHAPKAGSRVRVERMATPYWTSRFNGARRIGGI
jgi:cell wall-associated NlpC family hydrolase